MTIFSDIPVIYHSPFERTEMLNWLRSLPVEFHDRLNVYFAWLDHFGQSYNPDEIDSLKTQPPPIHDILTD